jgi:tetratricopeptide (TPR) repeat protein
MTKIIALLAFAVMLLQTTSAQAIDSLQALARSQMQAGDFESACKTLDSGLKSQPNNLALLKDQLFANILKRDFVTSIQLGVKITQRTDADAQCYQLLGSVYKELAEYKEGAKMYKEAIKKFPESGVLFSEYGDLLMQNNAPEDAIRIWEQGIQADVNNSGNYYYAAKHYITKGRNVLRGLLYGEIFANIESYTQRTTDTKKLLLQGYQQLLAGNTLKKAASTGSGFTNIVATILNNNAIQSADSISTEQITELRWKFIVDWFTTGKLKQYPYRLFDLHKQLVDYKIFDAYNQWLFGDAADADKYQQWQTTHADQLAQWMQMLHSIVFKIPAGQYYPD